MVSPAVRGKESLVAATLESLGEVGEPGEHSGGGQGRGVASSSRGAAIKVHPKVLVELPGVQVGDSVGMGRGSEGGEGSEVSGSQGTGCSQGSLLHKKPKEKGGEAAGGTAVPGAGTGVGGSAKSSPCKPKPKGVRGSSKGTGGCGVLDPKVLSPGRGKADEDQRGKQGDVVELGSGEMHGGSLLISGCEVPGAGAVAGSPGRGSARGRKKGGNKGGGRGRGGEGSRGRSPAGRRGVSRERSRSPVGLRGRAGEVVKGSGSRPPGLTHGDSVARIRRAVLGEGTVVEGEDSGGASEIPRGGADVL